MLDKDYLEGLGQFDVVYAWGVLHHTGSMWQALENIAPIVKPGAPSLSQSITTRQSETAGGDPSRRPTTSFLPIFAFWFFGRHSCNCVGKRLLKELLMGRPFSSFRNYTALRGMSLWRDVVDWVGGYPFEVVKPEQIFDFYYQRGQAGMHNDAGG